jgi:hypothetical protein
VDDSTAVLTLGAFMLAVFGTVVGYIYSQARVLKRWRAVWRVIGALPALAIGGYAVKLAHPLLGRLGLSWSVCRRPSVV